VPPETVDVNNWGCAISMTADEGLIETDGTGLVVTIAVFDWTLAFKLSVALR
jgi:hypothetical protein